MCLDTGRFFSFSLTRFQGLNIRYTGRPSKWKCARTGTQPSTLRLLLLFFNSFLFHLPLFLLHSFLFHLSLPHLFLLHSPLLLSFFHLLSLLFSGCGILVNWTYRINSSTSTVTPSKRLSPATGKLSSILFNSYCVLIDSSSLLMDLTLLDSPEFAWGLTFVFVFILTILTIFVFAAMTLKLHMSTVYYTVLIRMFHCMIAADIIEKVRSHGRGERIHTIWHAHSERWRRQPLLLLYLLYLLHHRILYHRHPPRHQYRVLLFLPLPQPLPLPRLHFQHRHIIILRNLPHILLHHLENFPVQPHRHHHHHQHLLSLLHSMTLQQRLLYVLSVI